MKKAQPHWLLEKCTSKPQWDTISHQSEWLLLKSQKITDAGEIVKENELFTLLVGMQINSTIVEDSVVIPRGPRNRNSIRPSNPITGYISKGL